jgi:hypothetical protein
VENLLGNETVARDFGQRFPNCQWTALIYRGFRKRFFFAMKDAIKLADLPAVCIL